MKLKEIHSTANPLLKTIRSLHDRAGRRKSGLFLIEGDKVIMEAQEKGIKLRDVVVSRSYLAQGSTRLSGSDVDELNVVEDSLFKNLSTTMTPSGILATAPLLEHKLERCLAAERPFLVVADAVQDPGNLGTLIRSSLAFDVTAVLLTRGTVDPYSPKVVRSAMGALFSIPIVVDLDAAELFNKLKERRIEIVSLDSHADRELWDAAIPDEVAFVLGNEGQGLSGASRQAASHMVRIPISSASESLNVAIAAGIVLAYCAHKRSKK